jgi:hypothetical protein
MPGPHRHRGSGRGNRPPERRKPPDEATGEERRYLDRQLNAGARLRVEQIDGSHSEGTVRAFHDDSIELDTDERRGLMLRKSQIRYIEETD